MFARFLVTSYFLLVIFFNVGGGLYAICMGYIPDITRSPVGSMLMVSAQSLQISSVDYMRNSN